MKKETKDKLKIKLEKYLNRNPSKDELANAEKDYNLLNEIILEEVELLQDEVKKLKNGN